MNKKTLEELNLMDNFLFETVLSYPELGEEAGRLLLNIIYGRKTGKIKVIPQKVYPGSDTGLHGARLDVYLEEEPEAADQHGTEADSIYDIEPEKDDRARSVKELPKRVRFYHAKIDAKSLRTGMRYESLKNVVIVMITPFDPFGLGRMRYTIQNGCVEEPDMPYDDGARTLFLFTKGACSKEEERALQQFLRYMECTTAENACNEDLRKLHKIVEEVRQDEEVSLKHMKLYEEIEWMREVAVEEGREEGMQQGREEGMQQGREEGIQQGREEGMQQGREEGVQQGREEGIQQGIVVSVDNVMKNLKLSLEKACVAVGTTMEAYETAKRL